MPGMRRPEALLVFFGRSGRCVQARDCRGAMRTERQCAPEWAEGQDRQASKRQERQEQVQGFVAKERWRNYFSQARKPDKTWCEVLSAAADTLLLERLDPHVIARNLLLLELMLDQAVPLETCFALWFSMGLTDSQWKTCIDKIEGLVKRCMGRPEDSPVEGCSFDNDSGRSWLHVLETWQKWLVMAGHTKEAGGKFCSPLPSHEQVLQKRRNTLAERWKQPGTSSVFQPVPRHAVTVDEVRQSVSGVVNG